MTVGPVMGGRGRRVLRGLLWAAGLLLAVALGYVFLPPTVASVLLAQGLARPVFGGLRLAGRRAWTWPAALLLAVALAGLYYGSDLLLSPHGHRAAHRLRDALAAGALAALAGVATERVLRPKAPPAPPPRPPRKRRPKKP